LVIELYNGDSNPNFGFEKNEELREYLKPLLKQASISTQTTIIGTGVSSSSNFYALPNDVLYIVREDVIISTSPMKKLLVKVIS
jgi:hypothetical protein